MISLIMVACPLLVVQVDDGTKTFLASEITSVSAVQYCSPRGDSCDFVISISRDEKSDITLQFSNQKERDQFIRKFHKRHMKCLK